MGTIVSPSNGSSFYHGATIQVTYRSDTVDFNCASLSRICLLNYLVDGVSVSGGAAVNVSQQGVAPQTQAPYSITLPATGATSTIDVEGWSVGGQRNDTAASTYNLVAPPTAVCDAATLVAQNDAQLNGTIAGTLLAGGSARFVYGTGVPNTNLATSYTAGAVNAALAGLAPGTTYNYRLEVLDDTGNVIATSAQCSLTTLAAPVTATCGGTAALSATSATLQGNIANIPAGGSVRFSYGLTLGGPYPTTVAAAPYANGGVNGNVTGLTPDTPYHYITEVLDGTGTVVAASSDCSFTTLAAPATQPEAQLVKFCSVTNVSLLCDKDNDNEVLLVTVSSADGDVIPVDSTEFVAGTGAGVFSAIGYYRSYYADVDGNYLATQPTNVGSCSSSGAIEVVCRCDDTDGDGVPDKSYKSVVKVAPDGSTSVLASYENDLITAYAPVAPLDCQAAGSALVRVVPRAKSLSGAGTWTLNTDSTAPTQSVALTVVKVGSNVTPPTVTDVGGVTSLAEGVSMSWSVVNARDVAGLKPPLVITTQAGDFVLVNWTEESA